MQPDPIKQTSDKRHIDIHFFIKNILPLSASNFISFEAKKKPIFLSNLKTGVIFIWKGVFMAGLNIMVVVDNPVDEKILVKTLKETGLEINEILETELTAKSSPDVIFCEWNKVRACRNTLKSLPIIMVTSESDIEKIKEARDAGANAYVTKPFTAEKLKEKIKQVLENTKN
jgi:CheY-like chemotaxis protein